MTQNTPVFGFPYPENTDPPNGPAQFQALALGVETVLSRMDTQTVIQKYTTTTVWNKPAGLKGVWVRVTGGGGGSGACDSALAALSPSAGGGGGGTSEAWIPASSLAATVTATVGTGGIAGATPSGTGGTGVASSFGAHVSAPGGTGGSGAGNGTTQAWSSTGGSGGGQAGGGSFSGTATRLDYMGQDGEEGKRETATLGKAGTGGASGMHLGASRYGSGGATAEVALAGNVPGGGAAGGVTINTATDQAGAAGARGEVVVIEMY